MARFRWTIKRKLLTLGGGTLLPLLLLLGSWVWWEFREHTEAIEAELTLASRQAAGQVELLLGRVAGQLEALLLNPAVQRRQVRSMEETFRRVTARSPDLENLAAFGTDGQIIAAAVASPAAAPVTVADRPWFRQVMATGQPAVSGLLSGRLTGQLLAVVAIPLRGEDGPVAGVLTAALNLGELSRRFEALPLIRGRTMTVVDGEGQVLSQHPSSDTEGWIGRRLPSAAALPAGPAVVKRLAWVEGEERIAAVAPVAGTGWRVLVGIPRTSLERRIWEEVRAIAGPLLALLAVSSLTGLLIARRVWRPLQALADAAARLPSGEEVPVRADSTDEVGELARTFTAMAAQLRQSRASLERRVSELTALTEAGQLLTGTLELPEVFQRLTELARTRLGADIVRIWLREGDSGALRLGSHAGPTHGTGGYRVRLQPGEGLAGWIIEHREPLALEDLRTDTRLASRDWAEANGVLCYLGVPILLEDVPVGVLSCMRRERRAFSRDDMALARLFTLPAAVAILNARLYAEAQARTRELSERNRQLELLHATAGAITVEHDLDRLLQRIAERARELCGAGYGAVAMFDEEGRVRAFFTAGITPEERERIGALPEGRGLLGYVFKHGKTLRLDDLTSHPAAAGFPPGHPPMRTLLALPIRLRGEILGALYLTEKPGGFTADDEAPLGTLAADAAVAIENARLVGSLRRALDDLKATQDQLVQGETLRAMGRLASGMAHHLNNILAVIRGRILLLLQKVEEPSVRRTLETVEQATVRASEVVRAAQGFSRAQPLPETVPVDLNQLVQDALTLTRPRLQDEAQRQGVSIETHHEAGSIPAAAGDPAALKDVLVDLLVNAADALPAGGRITVRTSASQDRVHCSVADTGVGMSEEIRRRALEPFFTTKGPQSRGLGLSVAHRIVQRHGGTLGIESTPGGGTTVTISLLAAPAKPASESAAPGPPRRILVIDDETEVRETLAEILAAQGHRVSQAAGGAAGLALFQAQRHDLVFTDLGMLGMTGAEVAEAIKALSPVTPVILVTGWGDEEIASVVQQAGWVDHVIRKPFDLDGLAAALARTGVGRPG